MGPAIKFEDVVKTYPLYHQITGGLKNFIFHLPGSIEALKHAKRESLRGLSFEVAEGESFGIIGKNGAGKSTILGLIAGVLRPNAGRVTVTGRISPLLELGAGLHMELTGRENIVLKGVLIGLRRSEVVSKMDDIISFSGLDDFIDQPVRTYSSGMLARLGFSIVASLDPEILLIDEILAVGDGEFQRKCIERMIGFRKRGVTMVFVSHSMESIELICDRVMWIDDHKAKLIGPPREVVKAYCRE